MFKTGIHHISQLDGSVSLKSLLGKDRVVSVTLYDQILDFPNADFLAERILDCFSDERGVYKRTYANRFEAFDAHLLQMMEGQFDPASPMVVADVSVSDGRTACDLFERLAPRFPRIAHYASDFSPHVLVLKEGRFTLTLSRKNRILEMMWPPFVFSAMKPETPHFYPLNFVLRKFMRRFLAEPLLRKHLAGQAQTREIQLFSMRALNLVRKDARFHLGEQNILEPLMLPEPAHLVRSMNVLNPTYFTPADLARVVGNFHRALRPGGWLVAGSNEDAGSVVHGAVYRKTEAGFERIWQSGQGLELETHVLSWQAPAK
ncbi:MAG: hypothetical protein HY014_06910 [Acidobacteria bacterium]|nr:hypothetical protein [Acidobacteriota bacterium]MBI3487881.1 hypothetical protein [Acidobacteriota bacterium]